jgi:hypothetical protein
MCVTRSRDLNNTVALYDELALGRRELSAMFRSSPPRTLKAGGELLVTTAGSSDGIYHLRAPDEHVNFAIWPMAGEQSSTFICSAT